MRRNFSISMRGDWDTMPSTASSPIVLLLCAMVVSHCWGAYDLDEKFSELEEKMDLMLDAMGINTETNNTTESSPIPEEEIEEELPSVRPWINLLSLTRKTMGDNTTQLTIKFKTSGRGLVHWSGGYLVAASYTGVKQQIEGSTEIQEVTFSTSTSSNYYLCTVLFLYQGTSRDLAHIEMILRNGDDEEVTAPEINLPILGIQPQEEFVYEQGQNMNITLKLPAIDEIDEYSRHPNLRIQVLLFDETGEIDYNIPRKEMYEVLNVEEKVGHRILTVELNTSVSSPRGYMMFEVDTNYAANSTIFEEIKLIKEVGIRERNQSGPLPDGFLSFTSQKWNEYVNDTIQIPCRSDYNCNFFCVPVGEDIAGFSLVKVENNGSETLIDTIERYESPFHTLQFHEATYPSKTEGTDHFECRAEDSQGKLAVQAFDINYYRALRILRDGSGVVFVNAENESSPVLQMVLTCVAEGEPLPNVTFSIGTPNGSERGVLPDEVTQDDDDTVIAVKYVALNPIDDDSYGARQQIWWARCSAQDDVRPWHKAFYDFNIPHNIGK